jgi:hypothetical protein
MSDLTAYRAEMKAKNRDEDMLAIGKQDQHEMLVDWLREFVTPPLNYTSKKETVNEVRLWLEGWTE